MDKRVFSKAPWEKKIGYCRAIRRGNLVFVTGTAAIDDQGNTFAPGDAYAQAKRCLYLVGKALKEVGADLSTVVRTRIATAHWAELSTGISMSSGILKRPLGC